MNKKGFPTATASFPRKIKWGRQYFGRRVFVKRIFLAGLLTQIPFKKALQSVAASSYKTNSNILSEKQKTIVRSVQRYLFPNDGNGPDAMQVNSLDYVMWVLSDPLMDPSDVKYIIDGIGWVEETADEEYGKSFLDLNQPEKEALIALIAKEGWGSSWFSIILGYIFEALVADPLYGGNTDESGWKWLSYFPGYPRPTESLLYGNILKTVNEQ